MKSPNPQPQQIKKTQKAILWICLGLIFLLPIFSFTSGGWAGKKDSREEDLASAGKPKSASPMDLWTEENKHQAIELCSHSLSLGASSPKDEDDRSIVLIDYFKRVLKGKPLTEGSARTLCLYVGISTWENFQSIPLLEKRVILNEEGLIWRIPKSLLGEMHPVFTTPLWLEDYFSDHLPTLHQDEGALDVRIILELPHEKYGCWEFDPTLDQGLSWWDPGCPASQIPVAYRLFRDGLLSLEDQWVPLSWSHWLSTTSIPPEVILLHIDDHQDMMDPRLGETDHGHLFDFITGDQVDFQDPASVKKAILSGAIGKGSILTPLVFLTRVHVRHLTARPKYGKRMALVKQHVSDSLLTQMPPSRLHLSVEDIPRQDDGLSNYYDTDHPEPWLSDLPKGIPVLLHVDMDYFNNRYDGNSGARTYDPPQEAQKSQMDTLCGLLRSTRVSERIVHTSFGVSPGFYPGEFWPLTDYFIAKLLETGIDLGPRLDPDLL